MTGTTMRWALCSAVLAACGGEGGTSEGTAADTAGPPSAIPDNVAVSQTSVSADEFEAATAGTSAVADLVAAAEADGFTTAVGWGRLETSNKHIVHWSALANSTGDTVTVLLDCVSAECAAIRGTVVDGVARFTAPDGASVNAPVKVAPVLSKDLDGADHDGRTEIAGPLTVEGDPKIDLSTRELVVASAFGDVHGVSLEAFAAAAASSGGFTKVRTLPYVTEAALDAFFLHGSPADALIWIGASVREPLGTARKTVGLTVNRGIYGDATYKASSVRDHLAKHPFGGPGLVLLLGEDTRGDGSGQDDAKLSLFSELSNTSGHRSVVGVRGRADAASILAAGEAFAAAFFGGASVADALSKGNEALEGTDAELVSDRLAKPETVFFAGGLDAVLGEPAPTEGISTHVLSVNATCLDADNKGTSESAVVNAFANVTFNGAFFSGGRDFEVDGQAMRLDVSGVILGTEAGANVFVKFGGDLQPGIRGLTAYGVGTVTDRKEVTKPKRLYYEGTASATAYTNAAGHTCLLKSPELKGKTAEQVSWLEPK